VQASDTPPSWLLDEQVTPFRRVLAALRSFGGALLADAPGSGKTYVALAAAARWSVAPATCLVPAAIAGQWRHTAARLGVSIQVVTHQAASRGRLPSPSGLVVIDESHHLRNTAIRRYAHVARWLVGRGVLLLTATPAVNHLDDLAHQLALALRDDALALHGIPSIRNATAANALPAGFAAVVIAGRAAGNAIPVRNERRIRYRVSRVMGELLAEIDGLVLSTDQGIATLVRGVLVRAAASSAAALAASLLRYRLLLLHARDAAADDRPLGREAIRRWVGTMPDQMVLWPLVASPEEGELALVDLEAVDALVASARRAAAGRQNDSKLSLLRALLADGQRTIVFASARETVADLRRRLPGAAWCTGNAAGVGHIRLDRATVLGWFAPGARDGAPRLLVTTDVAAEGLDLHGASRVVHYDLPWTAMRLEQRAGRAARRGSTHRAVDVVHFQPPPQLEHRLGLTRAIAAKAKLPARAGLGPGDPLGEWRDALDEAARQGPGTGGVAWLTMTASADVAGILAGVQLVSIPGGAAAAPATLLWVPARGAASSDPAVVARALRAALRQDCTGIPVPADLDRVLGWIDAPARQLLRTANGARWSASSGGSTRQVARRIAALGRQAARLRDAALLSVIDRALMTLGGGLTAGEQLCVDALAGADDRTLITGVSALPERAPGAMMEARLVGVVIVRR
jgi:superfamily II DNA or RNA helicase